MAGPAYSQAKLYIPLQWPSLPLQKVDATLIEGFLPKKLDELLNLKGSGYKSTLIPPWGYTVAAEVGSMKSGMLFLFISHNSEKHDK